MFEVTREMGCSIDDLVRWFPLAMGDFYAQTSLQVNDVELFRSESPLIEIFCATKDMRKIALLSIPVLSLRLQFHESLGLAERGQIMERFDLYTRRGGG